MKVKSIVFGLYSYLTNLLWSVLDIMPYFLRNLFFKVMFKSFGSDTFIDYGCYMRYPSRINIGDYVSINRGTKLFASYYYKNVKIEIGNHVAIGPEVSFFAAGHDYNYYELPDIASSIIVQDYVWIGGKSIILPGITIGEGAVIGAGSVVTKDVLPYTVVAGNPANFVKKINKLKIKDKS